LFFILATSGITFLITYSVIFEPLRSFIDKRSDFLGELFSCPMCAGFWTGLAVSFISFPDYNIIYAGAITSFACWMVAMTANYINTITVVMDNTVEEE
jgi:hypothetical protein